MIYLLVFCRMTIGLVFALSSFGKARDFAQFQQAIVRFQPLSRRLSKLAALLFLGGEGAVVLLIVIGGPALLPGFALAILLLLIFCAAVSNLCQYLPAPWSSTNSSTLMNAHSNAIGVSVARATLCK